MKDTQFNRWLAGKLGKEEKAEQSAKAERFGAPRGSPDYFVVPMRAIDAPDQSGDGANLVPEVSSGFITGNLSMGGSLLDLCTLVMTEHGNELKYPVSNEPSKRGTLRASLTTTATEGALPTFQEQRVINAYPIDSDFVQLSRWFSDDVEFDFDAYVSSLLYRRIGREIEYQAMRGTGAAGNPTGLMSQVSLVNKTGVGDAIEWTDLSRLMESIDPAWLYGEGGLYGYRHRPGKIGWLTSWEFAHKLVRLKDGDGAPLLNMDDMRLLGYPVHISPSMPATGFDASGDVPIVFGNFGYWVVRLAHSGDMMVSPLHDSMSVRDGNYNFYIARCRMDSNSIIAPNASGKLDCIKGLVRA